VEQVYEPDATAPTDQLDGTVVPAGQVWVVESISCTDRHRVTTYNLLSVVKSGITLSIAEGIQPAADRFVFWCGRVTLKEGDRVVANFVGTVAGDDLLLRYCGYRMYVAE